MCGYWGISRQAWYKAVRRKQEQSQQELAVVRQVRQLRREQSKLGGRKAYNELKEQLKSHGKAMGRDKFFELLRRHDLLVKRRRKYAVTTHSGHPYYKYSNELEKVTVRRPNQAWVSDITYLRTHTGFVYLSLVTDRYSRKILGWEVSASLGVEGTLQALKKAMGQCRQLKGIIHHSDRGIQYCCYPYTDLLKQKGMRISMGSTGNCYENAVAERVNGILKDEYLLDSEFTDINQAIQATRQAIYLYNYKRPHWSLHLKKPAEVHDTISN